MKIIDNNVLKDITRRLAAEFQPEQIILFGSHAWGTPTKNSDLDLLVIVPESKQSPTQRAARAHLAMKGLLIPTDILVKTRSEFDRFSHIRASLSYKILKQGRVLYGQGKTGIGTKLVD